MSIFVIRPGDTDYDAQDRIQGALDLPLNASGLAQVDGMAEQLRDADLEIIYTSPSEPSLSTAQRLGKQLQLPVKVLDGLSNLDLGLWQGLSRKEVRHKQPRVFRQWEEAPQSVCPPCGEAPELVVSRVARALKKPLKRENHFAVVVSEPLASLVLHHLQEPLPRVARPARLTSRVSRLDVLEPAGA